MAIRNDAVSVADGQTSNAGARAAAGMSMRANPWVAPVILVAVGIVLNIAVGQLVRNVLALPVYLDSIGTILAGALGGPLVGAFTGAVSNVIWGLAFNDPKIIPYAITAAAIGVAAGIAASLGAFRHPSWALLAGLLTGVLAAVVSAPISVHVNGGVTGGGGQAVIDRLDQIGGNLMASATLQSFLSDPIDKAISFGIVWLILRYLPAEIRARVDIAPSPAQTHSYRSSWRYGLAAALSLLALVIAIVFWPATGRVILAVFYIAVVLSAWNGGIGPGLLATGFAAAAAVLLPSIASDGTGFTVGDAVNLCIFLTVSLLIALITEALDRVNRALNTALDDERRTEAEIRSLVDSVVETLVLVSPEGRVVSVNHRFEELFGSASTDVEGKQIADLQPLIEQVFVDPAAVGERMTATDDEVKRTTAIVAQKWPQERQLALFSTAVESDGRTIGTLYGFRDVTQERELDRMKTEFVSQVSHELRTPLTAIKGFTDLILDGDAGDVNEEQSEYLGIVKSNADRLVALINDLLDVSRIESGRIQLKLADVDLRAILEMVIATMRPLLEGKQQRLTLTVEPGLPIAYCDHDRTVQVTTNLVSNAHKYTQAGGSIEVSVARRGDFIVVAVRDNGMGIAAEDIPRLFSRFFRVDNSLTREIGGTGLGLSIVKSIVEMQGGEVSLESEPGKGSTFAFTVPVAAIHESTEAGTTAGGRAAQEG
jgi:PAS domain S-box-containing protein